MVELTPSGISVIRDGASVCPPSFANSEMSEYVVS
jgi:hypothetical protein